MNTRYIICCGGSQKKWNNFKGVPSHLVTDKSGTPILHRTMGQIQRFSDAADVLIMAPVDDPRYFVPGALVVEGDDGADNEFWASRFYWNYEGRTTLILGDVWFSDEAMETITSNDGDLRFFGRYGPSKVTGSPWGELFATSFESERMSFLANAMSHAAHSYHVLKTSSRNIGWEILRAVQGQSNLDLHIVTKPWFVEIDDLTDDVDFPDDYKRHPMFG